MGKKKVKIKTDSSKLIGLIVLGIFSIFFGSFIYQFATSEKTDATKQWCPTHNTFHDINAQSEDEIWCNNCKAWHAPNQESSTPAIK